MSYDSERRLWWAASLLVLALLIPIPAFAEPVSDEGVESVEYFDSGDDFGVDEPAEVDSLSADEAASAPLSISSTAPSRPFSSVTGGTYWDLASSVVAKSAVATDDYLFYRSGEYEYYLLIGDLSLDGSTFSGSDLRAVRFWRSGLGYDGSWHTESGEASASVYVGDYIVASSLGDYPAFDLPGRSVSLMLGLGFGLLLALYALRGLFRSVRGF